MDFCSLRASCTDRSSIRHPRTLHPASAHIHTFAPAPLVRRACLRRTRNAQPPGLALPLQSTVQSVTRFTWSARSRVSLYLAVLSHPALACFAIVFLSLASSILILQPAYLAPLPRISTLPNTVCPRRPPPRPRRGAYQAWACGKYCSNSLYMLYLIRIDSHLGMPPTTTTLLPIRCT